MTPQNVQNPIVQDDALSPLALTTCATSPPQYMWILKGACTKILLKSTGANFALQQYQNITVKGSIGDNNLKAPATVYVADAVDKSDIEAYKGKAFPKYNGRGTTFLYAVAINQSKSTIVPKAKPGKPVLQYVITDAKGLPGKTCSAAVLAKQKNGTLKWTALPIQAPVKGKTVTLTQYEVPRGFQFPSKTPVYFAANCF